MSLDRRLQQRLDQLAAQGLTRRAPAIEPLEGPYYDLDGRRVLGLCSNDYLGLATHPAPTSEQVEGAGASRLISGDHPIHRALERDLADATGHADAVLFPSGYQLNVGVLPALVRPEDPVFSDRLNHASLIDGLRLSKARPRIVEHLAAPSPTPGAWWITESLFSMDGDGPDPEALRAHLGAGGYLYIDEAHAFGLFGAGTTRLLPHGVQPTVTVGTLGKALGTAGAFVAASTTVCNWVRTRARSFVFTTGTSPVVAARAKAMLALVRSPAGDRLRERLWANVAHLANALDVPAPLGPIFPIVVGDNDTALTLGRALLEDGFHAQPIRPPTVPDGRARVRVTVSAAHDPDDLTAFARALQRHLGRHQRAVTLAG